MDAKTVNDSFESLLSLIPKNVNSHSSNPLGPPVDTSTAQNTLSIDQLRQKMRARVELIRANKSASTHETTNTNTLLGREQLLDERRQRLAQLAAEAEEDARRRKLRKNRRKTNANAHDDDEGEEGEDVDVDEDDDDDEGEEDENADMNGEDEEQNNERKQGGDDDDDDDMLGSDQENDNEEQADSITFSKLDFNVGRKAIDPLRRKKPSANSSKHPELALAKISSRKKFLDHLAPASRERAEEKDRWQNATRRAQGQKVFDNESKLQKMIKSKDKKRAKSKQAWAERKEEADTKFQAKQKQRQENIDSRKNAKNEKKTSKGSKQQKKKSRPGFEGSNRLKFKKSAGGGNKKPKSSNNNSTPAKAGTKRKRP